MTQETTAQPSVESKRNGIRKLSAEAIHALCSIKSHERLEAQRDLQKAEDAFNAKARALNEEHRLKFEAEADARAEVEAHKDYLKPGGPVERGELTRQEYDEEHRALEAAAKVAKETLDKSQNHRNDALAPFRKNAQDVDRLVQDLTRQWKSHERKANEAGVDISDLWTPDKPIPPEEAPTPGA